VGAAGRVLSTIVGLGSITLIATGCYQLVALRRAVYGLNGPAQ
jgi:hypothetical protein